MESGVSKPYTPSSAPAGKPVKSSGIEIFGWPYLILGGIYLLGPVAIFLYLGDSDLVALGKTLSLSLPVLLLGFSLRARNWLFILITYLLTWYVIMMWYNYLSAVSKVCEGLGCLGQSITILYFPVLVINIGITPFLLVIYTEMVLKKLKILS